MEMQPDTFYILAHRHGSEMTCDIPTFPKDLQAFSSRQRFSVVFVNRQLDGL